MDPVGKIHTIELFPGLGRKLLEVLRSLTIEQWNMPTACGDWTVKDVAAHLLGGSLIRLWLPEERGLATSGNPLGYGDLLDQINENNQTWIKSMRRISPHILIELTVMGDRYLYQHFKTLDMDAPARSSVAWAGEDVSANWFDIAREYSEKWLHQMHIREAAGRPLLTTRAHLHPTLDTFLRALPHTFRGFDAREGSALAVRVRGEAGGDWALIRVDSGWALYEGSPAEAEASVELDQDLAWRLFSKGIALQAVQEQVRITGNLELGQKLLETVSIVA